VNLRLGNTASVELASNYAVQSVQSSSQMDYYSVLQLRQYCLQSVFSSVAVSNSVSRRVYSKYIASSQYELNNRIPVRKL
jgi:hypothetical protein